MTRDEITNTYTIEDGVIRSLGKFESEPVYAPYYWDVVLDGFADPLDWSEDETTWVCEITTEDRAMFPEIPADAVAIHLEETGQGFVNTETLTAAELGGLSHDQAHSAHSVRD